MNNQLQAYQAFQYEEAQALDTDPLISALSLLKLNEQSATFKYGSYFSKPTSEHLQQAYKKLQIVNEKEGGQQYLLAQSIADYMMDIDIEDKICNCSLGEASYYLGLQLFEKNLYDRASKELQNAKDLNPIQETNKLIIIVTCYIQLGYYDKCHKILEHCQHNSINLVLQSKIAYEKPDQARSQQLLNEAFKLDPNCFYAKIEKARQQHNPYQIQKLIEEALQKDPTNNRLKRFLIQAILKVNKLKINRINGEYAGLPRGPAIEQCMKLLDEIKQKQYYSNLKLTEAQLLLYEHYFEVSLQKFEEVLKLEWEPGKCRYYMGLIYKRQMNYQKALESFQLAIDYEDKKDQSIFERALIFYQLGQYQEAIKELEIVKDTVQSNVLLGKIAQAQGDLQQANTYLIYASKLNKNSLYLNVQKSLFTNKLNEGIQQLENNLKEDQYNWCIKQELLSLYMQRAQSRIHITWGEYASKPKGQDILKSMEIVTEFKTRIKSLKLNYNEALLNFYLDNNTLAYSQFEESIQKQFQIAQCRYYQGRIKKDYELYDQALDLFKMTEQQCQQEVPEGQELFLRITEISEQRAQVYLKLNQPDMATKELENAKQDCQYFVQLGQAMILKNDIKQAEVWFDESLKLDPNCIYSRLAKSIISKKQDEVIKILDSAIKADPENYVLQWAKGKTLNRMNKFDQAIGLFDKPMQLGYLPAFCSKGKSLRGLKQLAESTEIFKKGVEKCQEFTPLFCELAVNCIKQNQYDEALNFSNQALSIKSQNLRALRLKALCLQKMNKPEQAAEVYQQVLKIDHTDIKGFIGLIESAQGKGDQEMMFNSLQELQSLVVKNNEDVFTNPVVVKQAQEVVQMESEFVRQGGYIEQQLQHVDDTQALQTKQELQQLKSQKEQLCHQKVSCIMQPLGHSNSFPIDEFMKKLEQLSQQVENLQKQNNQLRLNQTTQNMMIEQLQDDNRAQWDTLRQSGAYDKAKIKDWYDQNQGTEKHNYAAAFYWTLLSHIDAYRIANTNVLQSNKSHAEDPKEKQFVEHVKAGLDAASELTTYVPFLGNICTLIDDVVDSIYSDIKNVRYANRIRSICKIVYENGTTEMVENLSLVLSKAAQEIADHKIFNQQQKQKEEQTNYLRYCTKFFEDKIKQVKEMYAGKEVKLYESIGGTQALRDVITVIAYLSLNYQIVLAKAQNEPLNKQISYIIINQEEEKLLQQAHPIPQKKLTSLSMKKEDLGKNDIEKRDQPERVDASCCAIQ